MPKIRLTINCTVDEDDFAAFQQDHTDLEDTAGSFDARLNEVFGNGPEVLTTVRVSSIEPGEAETK
jgi:hypothetical protein